ncbi:MAG: hypothetical protein WC456_02545 [Patescibacteria group bacterium]
MPLSNSDKIKLINDIYRDFSSKVRSIEAERDQKINSLLRDDDQAQIAQIRRDLSIKIKD